jgi:hypothetical protein
MREVPLYSGPVTRDGERGGVCDYTSEYRGNNLKGFKDFYLQVKATMWP